MMNQQPHQSMDNYQRHNAGGNYQRHNAGGGSSGGGGGDNGMVQSGSSSIQNRLNFNNAQPEPVVHEPVPHKQVNCHSLFLFIIFM